MGSIFARPLRLSTLAMLFPLLGCGGGGGGGGGPTISVSPSALTFSANSSTPTTPPSQRINVTIGGGQVYVGAFYGGAAIASATFSITGSTTAEVTVYPAAPNILGPGSHSGEVIVLGCNDPQCNSQVSGSPATVSVTYSVSGLSAAPSSLTFSIGNTPSANDLTKSITVTGYPTGQSWTAASSVAWLSVAPTNGNTNAPVQISASLVQSQLNTLNNGTYSGSILLTPSQGGTTTIPITLTVSRTQVNYVAPYVATSGSSAEVVIRGDNFNAVGIQNVRFGGSDATAFNVISDTEIRATHPALAAGTYAVQIQTSVNVLSLANLVVVDAPAYPTATLAYPTASGKTVTGITYDAERAALVVSLNYSSSSSSANNEFLRYVYGSSAWGTPTRIAVFNLIHTALSPDGTKWLASDSTSIRQYDATTLNLVATTNDSTNSPFSFHARAMAVANNGVAIATAGNGSLCGQLSRYQIRNPSFTSLNTNSCSSFPTIRVGGSADGSRLIVGNNAFSQVQFFDASTGNLSTPITLALSWTPSLNRTGSRIVLNNTRVYDENLTYLGGLPSAVQAVALNSAGTRAYGYVGGTTLRTYDLTAPLVAGLYPEIGAGTALPNTPGSAARMTLSHDGGTLFIAGSSAIVVVPTP